MSRSRFERRKEYRPSAPPEEFIVPLLKEQIESILQIYAVPASTRSEALDVGCGRQPFRADLESRGYAYSGLDVQQNTEGSVAYVCQIDDTLPEALTGRDPFEFVMCTEVLEHTADWNKAFENLSRLTAPGGRILITSPHFYLLHEEPYDFWRPTLYALEHYATKMNFKVLERKAVGDAWDVLGTLLSCCWAVPRERCLTHRLASRIVEVCRRYVFLALRTRRPQRMVNLQSPLYLSNVVVLERQ